MTNSRRPTLKTIAELTGLAVPTVSRALSGASDIGEKTRARVRQVADQVGYVPNRAGVRLRTGRTQVIALVLSTEADVMNLTAKLISSAAGALRQTSYHLVITPFFPDEDPMRPIRHIVETEAADAVIINQVKPQDERVRFLMERKFPFATHGRSAWAEQHAYYDFDNDTFARLATGALLGRGRRRLGLLAPPKQQNYAQEMIAGARAAIAGHGSLAVFEGINSDDPSDVIEAEVARQARTNPPWDGIIFASSGACMAAATGVESTGMTIGKDIDFFSKEAAPFLSRFRPGIMSLNEDAGAAGAFLARAAIDRIEHPSRPPMQHLEVPTLD